MKNSCSFRELGDQRGEGNILGNLALLLRHQGRRAEAEKHYLNALRIHCEVGNRRAEGYILNGLGNLSEDDEASLEWFRMALTINTEVGDRRAIGMALANIGSIESEMSNFGAASKNLYEALEVFREIENLPLEAGTLHILGEMYFLKEDLDSAYSNVRQALEISRITKRRRTEVQGTVLLGRIKALQGDTEGAHELYRKAYDQILKYGFSSEIDEHFTDLRKLLQGNGIDPSALPWPPDWE